MEHPDEKRRTDRLAAFFRETESLAPRIEGLSPTARAALAASVAVRLLPDFLRFHEQTGRGEPAVLQGALDAVWNRLHHETDIDIVTVGVACLEQTPLGPDGLADFSTLVAGNAVHAVWAVTATLHCGVHGRVLEVLHTLRYGRSSALAVATHRDGAEPAWPAEDPLVQREVRRQLLDLEALEASGPAHGR